MKLLSTHFRWFTRIGVAIVIVLFVIHKLFPDLLHHAFQLSLVQSIAAALFAFIIEHMLIIEVNLDNEMQRSRRISIYSERLAAYDQFRQIIRTRSHQVKNVDLIQFSGDTAISVLRELAVSCPDATVRLLLFDKKIADMYDRPGLHSIRIQHTIDAIKLLQEEHESFKIEYKFYETQPGIAGIVVDDWLVSVGWYRVFRDDDVPRQISLRGHDAPAITAIDEEAKPLIPIIRSQFDAVFPTAIPV